MTKAEFEKLLGEVISPAHYAVVERVYTWYDDKALTKLATVQLYQAFGIKVFQDMLPRADTLAALDGKRLSLLAELEEVKNQINRVHKGEEN